MLTPQPFPGQLFVSYLPLIVGVLPLLAAVVAGLGGMKKRKHWLTTCLSALAMILGVYLLVLAYHGSTWHGGFTWLHIAGCPIDHCLRINFCIDFPTAVMISLTTTINFFTHLYALDYMQDTLPRYLALTGSFVSAMMAFLVIDNLIALFVSWELIGLGSYLFVSFWFQQETAAKNGTKTWLINQLGSVILFMGILIIGSELGSFDLSRLAQIPREVYQGNKWITVARCCLAGGVLTKSAQFPWFGWLPCAMTAPTPASALIHTTTTVGAGVYLLISLSPILGTKALTWIAYLGGSTAFMGACAALTQRHIKQVLAYSTISQLGYTAMAVGVGANSVALFHFVTHAFCKACLFLCMGVVSRWMPQQTDAEIMRHMGGLYKKLPGTFGAYLMAACSLVGIPGFAGYLSKEAILAHTWTWAQQQTQSGNYYGYLVPALGLFSSFLGVVYMGRQCHLVFMGAPRWSRNPEENIPHRTPRFMKISMSVLAFCSLDIWYKPLSSDLPSNWLLQRLSETPNYASTLIIARKLHGDLTVASSVIMALGLFFLLFWKKKRLPTMLFYYGFFDKIGSMIAKVGIRLSSIVEKFDSMVVYSAVRSTGIYYIKLSSMVNWLDRELVERTVCLMASVPLYPGRAHRSTQKGNLQHTLLWMFVGIGLLLWGAYRITKNT